MKRHHGYRMYYKRVIAFFLSIIIVLSVIFGYSYLRIRPVVMKYAISTAQNISLNTANQAIINVLRDNNITYDNIVNLSREDGIVTSLEIDIVKMNLLKSEIANEISRLYSKKEDFVAAIPVGTLFGNEYTTGIGPKIKFKMKVASTVIVDFESNFTSGGINQTLHQVIIKISLKGSLVIIGSTDGFSASTTAIAAQTVIVGVTPDAFTNVREAEDSGLAGIINDYGAQ